MKAAVCFYSIVCLRYSSSVLSAFQDTADLDLQFEKVYKWVASTPMERNMFIANLWMVSDSQFADHLERFHLKFFIFVCPCTELLFSFKVATPWTHSV